jgi:drug/metabolite transporter (DMT)-like permease
MTRGQALATMVAVTLMWSIAGVVSRWLDGAPVGSYGSEITFWRSAFNALALVVLLLVLRGPTRLWATLRGGGRALWLSGVCWSVMFTAFMVALTLTSVANVLVTMALGPLFTALLSRAALGHRLEPRTWVAIALAGAGIAWMHGSGVQGGDAKQWLGTLVALAVPIAGAINWTLLQHLKTRAASGAEAGDMLPAVLLGALISAAVMLPLAWPLQATPHDVGWLALLGVVQLAIPCLLAVAAARVLSGPEISLLALLEVVFGVAWAWLGAGETPSVAVLGGGALVLLALAGNELLALRRARAAVD